jgi:hypothetical protein
MRFARPQIRTLLVAVASASAGLAAAPNYLDHMRDLDHIRACPHAYGYWPPAPHPPERVLATASVIGVGTHVATLVVLALLPRMTTRRWMVAIATVAAPLAVKVHLSRVADQHLAVAEHHYSQGFLLRRGSLQPGSLYTRGNTSIGPIGSRSTGREELDGRDLARAHWHIKLGDKYRIAAYLPWVPVPPDPPEPD